MSVASSLPDTVLNVVIGGFGLGCLASHLHLALDLAQLLRDLWDAPLIIACEIVNILLVHCLFMKGTEADVLMHL